MANELILIDGEKAYVVGENDYRESLCVALRSAITAAESNPIEEHFILKEIPNPYAQPERSWTDEDVCALVASATAFHQWAGGYWAEELKRKEIPFVRFNELANALEEFSPPEVQKRFFAKDSTVWDRETRTHARFHASSHGEAKAAADLLNSLFPYPPYVAPKERYFVDHVGWIYDRKTDSTFDPANPEHLERIADLLNAQETPHD